MNIEPFALERYFARYEFSVRYQLSCSDCETLPVQELLKMAEENGFSGNMETLASLNLGYTESAGDPLLRQMIADRYRGIESDMILTAAPAEAIFLLFASTLEAGDHVLVMEPSYQSLSSVPRALGCEVIPWPVRPSWILDIEELRKKLHSGRCPKMVVVNFPHNPTGYSPDPELLGEIAALCDHHGVILFCDEMYRELALFGREMLPAACDLSDTAISLGGLSKSFGLPGLRMGWIVSKNRELIRKAASMKDYTTICSAPPVEFLSRAALAAEKALTLRARSIVEENCEASAAFFSTREEFTWIAPLGGSVAFPRYLGKEGAGALSERLIREADTLLLPGSLFNFDDSHFRVGLGRTDYPEALKRLHPG
jgi:aspartate/methionine/tyrosine aminotransferase